MMSPRMPPSILSSSSRSAATWLSAYMGHQNVLGTEVYLAATPELLSLASQRFERRLLRARRQR